MSSEQPRTPFDMGAGRLEAFSDAVMAVIITLLAFELKVPLDASWAAIRASIPYVLLYVLTFAFIAIYWNNHHHLLRSSDRISGLVMWANMSLLFSLSLIPVATEWIGAAYEQDFEPMRPVAFLGIVFLAAALSYTWLVRALIRANGPDSALARAIHGDAKGYISLALYLAGITAAAWGHDLYLAFGCYAVVSLIWLVPDRRFTHRHDG
jgi:uncharacterized membrane protein